MENEESSEVCDEVSENEETTKEDELDIVKKQKEEQERRVAEEKARQEKLEQERLKKED